MPPLPPPPANSGGPIRPSRQTHEANISYPADHLTWDRPPEEIDRSWRRKMPPQRHGPVSPPVPGAPKIPSRWSIQFGAYRRRPATIAEAGPARRPRCAISPRRKSRRQPPDELELELQTAAAPKDPNDERTSFLEIRAGTGGDEVGAVRRRPVSHVFALHAEPPALAGRVMSAKIRSRRLPGIVRVHRHRRLFAPEVRDPAAIASSGCRRPRPRAASTPRPAPWP